MTDSVTITACLPDGRPLEVMEELIKLRQRELHETTEMSVTATAINILKSLRAATKVAKVNGKTFGVFVTERPDLTAGFYASAKGMKGHRGIRDGSGHHMTGVKITNLIGGYVPGEVAKVFMLIVSYGRIENAQTQQAFERRYVIARCKRAVEEFARDRVKRRIQTYRGMAKWTLGQAMRRVSAQGAEADVEEIITVKGKRVGAANLSVTVNNSGYNSGSYSVAVLDRLDYSVEAIEGGISAFNSIMMKAANKTAAIINHFCQHQRWNVNRTVVAPFPEVQKK